jgi:hypothetical protein
MRTTVRIDDELLRRLKQQALAENVSLAKLMDRLLRRGLDQATNIQPASPFRQQTYPMGQALFDMNKALAFASDLEDEEILRKLAMRK